MTTPASQAQENPSLGVMLMIGFCICAPLLDVCAKLASETIPVGQVTAARFFFQAIIMLPIMRAMGFSFSFPLRLLRNLAFRALMLILSTYCFVAAIAVMPIADALAIVFVEPFILLIVGKYVFSETVGYRRLFACTVGFHRNFTGDPTQFCSLWLGGAVPTWNSRIFCVLHVCDAYPVAGYACGANAISFQLDRDTLMCAPILIWANGSGIVPLDPVWPEGVFWLYLIGVGAGASLSHLLMSLALDLCAQFHACNASLSGNSQRCHYGIFGLWRYSKSLGVYGYDHRDRQWPIHRIPRTSDWHVPVRAPPALR